MASPSAGDAASMTVIGRQVEMGLAQTQRSADPARPAARRWPDGRNGATAAGGRSDRTMRGSPWSWRGRWVRWPMLPVSGYLPRTPGAIAPHVAQAKQGLANTFNVVLRQLRSPSEHDGSRQV